MLLAVSGGIDSMYMAEKAYEQRQEFAVAHCNFSLRGDESDIDEKFVRRWCLERGIWYFCRKFDTAKYAADNGISIEMAARELRYSWFACLCEEQGFEAVAVAHNANDNAETMVLNLLRGTGGRGLRGMSTKRTMDSGLTIVRPLLGTTREEIRSWMIQNGCGWREDRTNADTRFKRNLIRQEVFPLFAKVNPSFLETFARTMEHCALENDIADDYFRQQHDGITSEDGCIIVSELLARPHWKYLLFRELESSGMAEPIFGELVGFLETSSGKNISGKRFGPVLTASDKLIIRKDVAPREFGELIVDGPGEYRMGSRTVFIGISDVDSIKSLKCTDGTLYADADALRFPFVIRGWRDGDWMKPFGMRGRKKLSDLFVDLKWSLEDKGNCLVAVREDDPSRVLELFGKRIDDTVKVTASTKEIIVTKI